MVPGTLGGILGSIQWKGPTMQFWFAIGSTYTYLSVMRLDRVAQETGAVFDWQPFSLRPITLEMNNVPFVGKPAKLAYMWRDLERRAGTHELPYAGPPPYPLVNAARLQCVAMVAFTEGWGKSFVQALYRHWFQARVDVSEEGELTAVLNALGKGPVATLQAAEQASVRDALAAQTQTARELGIFGSPTFAVGREIFWGDDRLNDAIVWERRAGRS